MIYLKVKRHCPNVKKRQSIDPYSYNEENFHIQTRNQEAQKLTGVAFRRIPLEWKFVSTTLLDIHNEGLEAFYWKKRAKQRFAELTSRLGLKSKGVGGGEN